MSTFVLSDRTLPPEGYPVTVVPSQTPEPLHPLDEILELYRVTQAAAAASTQESTLVEAWISLEPIDLVAGCDLIQTCTRALVAQGALVRDLMELACRTAARVEFGDLLYGGGLKPNPELAAKLRATGEVVLQALVGPRAVTRLFERSHSLRDFFERLDAYRTHPERLAAEDQAELTADGVSYPELRQEVCPPLLRDWLRDLERAFRRAKRRGKRADGRTSVAFPEDARPIEYAEGMRQVWLVATELPPAVAKLDLRVGELCRSFVRTHFFESCRTGSPDLHSNLRTHHRESALAALILVENLACCADLLCQYQTFEELLRRMQGDVPGG